MPEVTVRCADPNNVQLTVSATYTLAGWRGVLETWQIALNQPGSRLTTPVHQLREAIQKAIDQIERRETMQIDGGVSNG